MTFSYSVFSSTDTVQILSESVDFAVNYDLLARFFDARREDVIATRLVVNGVEFEILVVEENYLQGRVQEWGFCSFRKGEKIGIICYKLPILTPEAGRVLAERMK